MSFNYFRSQKVAARMITKYGMTCALRRTVNNIVQDRVCVAAVISFTPQVRQGALINPIQRVALVVAKDLVLAPLFGTDSLVTYKQPIVDPIHPVDDEIIKIVAPVGKLAPANIPIYYELTLSA